MTFVATRSKLDSKSHLCLSTSQMSQIKNSPPTLKVLRFFIHQEASIQPLPTNCDTPTPRQVIGKTCESYTTHDHAWGELQPVSPSQRRCAELPDSDLAVPA